jgi:hypothetical protein
LLANAGILYPKSPGAKQHSLLAFYAMNDDRVNLQTRWLPTEWTLDRAAWRTAFTPQLAGELAERESSHLLISTELFHSQLASREEIMRLKALLDTWCDSYRIVFFMRRQDQAQVSAYSTDLRTGGTPRSVLFSGTQRKRIHEYETVLALWEDVFGTESMFPRLYDKKAWLGGDLIADFMDASGLPVDIASLTRPPRRNTTLSRQAQKFLLFYNRSAKALLPWPERNRLQRIVADFIESACPGPSLQPSRDEAMAFYDAYRESNARVARKWFDREQLFDEGFDDYPEFSEPDEPLDPAELTDLTVRLVHHLMTQSVWLDQQRLDQLLSASSRNLPTMLAGFLKERSPELAEMVTGQNGPSPQSTHGKCGSGPAGSGTL